MPFQIIRNDITDMQTDAIVNSVSENPEIGQGVDLGIHKKAGPALMEARKALGILKPGDAALTPGFHLPASSVIHVVCPHWIDGFHQETSLLSRCCIRALELARDQGCRSIAFPMLGTGYLGFPRETALHTMTETFEKFLQQNDMEIFLVVFDRESFHLSSLLFSRIASYIEEHLVQRKQYAEADFSDFPMDCRLRRPAAPMPCPDGAADWENLLKERDAGFSETLVSLIEKSGRKNSEIYKRANIDKKLFSKIINNVNYHPSRQTALALAIALELSLEQAQDLIGRAGFTLSHSSKFDIILEYFLVNRQYDIFEINEVLFRFDQPLLGF